MFVLNEIEYVAKYVYTYSKYTIKKNAQNNIAIIRLELLDEWYKNYLDKIKEPVILIAGYSDTPIDESFKYIADDPRILKWYACNLTMVHPKVKPLPIGYHGSTTYLPWLILDAKKEIGEPVKNKLFHSRFLVHENRKECLKYCGIDGPKLHPLENYKELASSYYCISPDGMGIDCHRPWESLFFKTIPIIVKNPMVDMGMYDGLPIIVIDSWKEFPELKEKLTESEYHRIWNNFNTDNLTYSRWMPEAKDIGYTTIERPQKYVGTWKNFSNFDRIVLHSDGKSNLIPKSSKVSESILPDGAWAIVNGKLHISIYNLFFWSFRFSKINFLKLLIPVKSSIPGLFANQKFNIILFNSIFKNRLFNSIRYRTKKILLPLSNCIKNFR